MAHEYGIKLCRFYVKGTCNKGENCIFSHDPSKFGPDGTLLRTGRLLTFEDWAELHLKERKADDSARPSEAASEASSATESFPSSHHEGSPPAVDSSMDIPNFVFQLPSTTLAPSASQAVNNAQTWGCELAYGTSKLSAMVARPSEFSVLTLAKCIEQVSAADRSTLLNAAAVPPLFYAIMGGDEKVLQLLLNLGANASKPMTSVQGKHTFVITPVMAAILCEPHKPYADHLGKVRLLLAYGGTIEGIPQELSHLAKATQQVVHDIATDSSRAALLFKLNEHLNLVSRYLIGRAERRGAITEREAILVEANGLKELRRADFFEVGQEPVCRRVQEELLNRLYVPDEELSPLVLAFAGPSGHGKTNLAKAMADFASTRHCLISLETLKDTVDLFGVSYGYSGHEEGSPLTKHLAEYSGKLSIVIFDEVDKTTQKVRDALLTVLGEGTLLDRRTNRQIDCTKTIFLLCTNAGTDEIKLFFEQNEKSLQNHDPVIQNKYNEFSETIVRSALRGHFQAPFTSRISAVIPFLPFTPYEAQIAAGECFYQLRRNLGPHRQIVMNSESDEGLLSMLKLFADEYSVDAGYRSIKLATKRGVLSNVRMAHLSCTAPFPPKPNGRDEPSETIAIGTIKSSSTPSIAARMLASKL